MDDEYPGYLRYRPAPVKRGAWRIATGHCLGAIGIVLLAIVVVIALIGVIEISKHRKAWEMMGETVTGLHDVLVNGGGIIDEFQEAWKASNGTELLKRLLATDEYADDGSLIPYDEEYERDKTNKEEAEDTTTKHKSKEGLAEGLHNALGLVGDVRRSKFFYEWSLIGYHLNRILEKPETERAVKSLLSRSSDVMDQLDPVDLANIVAGMDLGPELKQALMAFTKIVGHIFGTATDSTTDRQTKQGEAVVGIDGINTQKTVIDRGMDALEKIAKMINAPEAKLILAQLSQLKLQSLIDQGQKGLNATTLAVEDFNRKHIMQRMDSIMIRSEEILGDIEEVVSGFEAQGVNIVLQPPQIHKTTRKLTGAPPRSQRN